MDSRPLLAATEIVFRDEGRFLRGSDNRWVWRRKGENEEGAYGNRENFEVDHNQTGHNAMFLMRPELNAEC
jgi:hypothetical protein